QGDRDFAINGLSAARCECYFSLAGRINRSRGFDYRLYCRSIDDLGNLENSDPFARPVVDGPFRRHLGLAALRRRHHSRGDFSFCGELCSGAPGRSTSAGRYLARVKPMSGEPSLSCHDVERFLGEDESRVHALRGVSLQLEPGSVHAVVGPSGCGKSTLLYILGLLDHPGAGAVMLESTAVSHLPDDELAQKRNEFIGFIFQFHFLMEDFTAQENVMMPMRRFGRLLESAMRYRAAALLAAVGLSDRIQRASRHLWGGEQQRVAI